MEEQYIEACRRSRFQTSVAHHWEGYFRGEGVNSVVTYNGAEHDADDADAVVDADDYRSLANAGIMYDVEQLESAENSGKNEVGKGNIEYSAYPCGE